MLPAAGSAVLCWKMLLPFKKRTVQLPCRIRHLARGDASSALRGYSPSSVLVTRTAVVLCKFLKLLHAFQLSPYLPPLSEGRQVAEGITWSHQRSPKPALLQLCQ